MTMSELSVIKRRSMNQEGMEEVRPAPLQRDLAAGSPRTDARMSGRRREVIVLRSTSERAKTMEVERARREHGSGRNMG